MKKNWEQITICKNSRVSHKNQRISLVGMDRADLFKQNTQDKPRGTWLCTKNNQTQNSFLKLWVCCGIFLPPPSMLSASSKPNQNSASHSFIEPVCFCFRLIATISQEQSAKQSRSEVVGTCDKTRPVLPKRWKIILSQSKSKITTLKHRTFRMLCVITIQSGESPPDF